MDLTTLSLPQLFTRQAELTATDRELAAIRNACAPGAFDWDLNNAALTGNMQDLADVAAEITRRITAQIEEARADAGPLTHVPMACTACGKPVRSYDAGIWVHVDTDDYLSCPVPDGTPVKARVDA
jgi:hypothetical protein